MCQKERFIADLNTIETWLRDKHLPLMFERKKGTGIL